MTLRDSLQAEAYRLGFSLVGVTTLAQPPHWLTFTNWMERGHHAGMAYLAAPESSQKRANPALLFPQARSILCLAFPYLPPVPASAAKPGSGIVAAYACGEDYHNLIPAQLSALMSASQRLGGGNLQFKGLTDSAPLLERDLAQRAGLGWIGKNTCLIHPRLGSYFFLAEVLVSLEIEPDEPFTADRCGSCRRCIEACPTGCILPDRTIDAARCLSYLTIENKGIIPPELRPALGNRIFGCDICQEVCPWNQHARPAQSAAELAPRAGMPHPNLIEEMRLSPEGFRQKFFGSPILRAKRRGYLRNVAVALGNQPDSTYLPVLSTVLEAEAEPLIRAHAAWAVKQINHPSAAPILDKLRRVETDPLVLSELN